MTEIVRINSALELDAEDVLREALGKRFEFVVLIGINQEGVHFKQSRTADTLKVLGAIEHAKHEIMKKWK